MNIYERTKTVVADLGEEPGCQSFFEATLRREGPTRIILQPEPPLILLKGLNPPLHCEHKSECRSL